MKPLPALFAIQRACDGRCFAVAPGDSAHRGTFERIEICPEDAGALLLTNDDIPPKPQRAAGLCLTVIGIMAITDSRAPIS